MNPNASPAPVQSAIGETLLYCDFPQRLSGTPLTVDVESSYGESALLVHPDVIRTYQRVIFELQLQIQRYRLMIERLKARTYSGEEGVIMPSHPLNAASIHLMRSIMSARVSEESILRAFEEEES